MLIVQNNKILAEDRLPQNDMLVVKSFLDVELVTMMFVLSHQIFERNHNIGAAHSEVQFGAFDHLIFHIAALEVTSLAVCLAFALGEELFNEAVHLFLGDADRGGTEG